ncbi:MAG: SGNH/GDSL hydrolase family protein [Elusimicrobiota bacterium]
MKRGLRRAAARVLLLLVSAAASVALAEVVLTVRGCPPGWTYAYASRWAVDDLAARYKLKPGRYPALFGSSVRINRYGARGPEPRRPEVLSLGDSCTFGVDVREEETYTGLLSARGIETINAGVPGYNSYIGLRHLQNSALLSLRPKLVTIYFGWNDHWRAVATERAFARLRGRLAGVARYSRVASRLLALQRSYWDPGWRHFRWIAEVPLDQFKENLREMVAASRKAGAAAVLITAPSEPRLAAENVGMFQDHSLAEFRDHERYVAAVREVAAETGAGLVDLELELRRRSGPDPHEYFIDFVHLNGKGHRLLADMLAPWARCARGSNGASAAPLRTLSRGEPHASGGQTQRE